MYKKNSGVLKFSKILYNKILNFFNKSFINYKKTKTKKHSILLDIPNDLPELYKLDYKFPYVDCIIEFNEDGINNGELETEPLYIKIICAVTNNKINNITYIKSTIEHELIHLTQHLFYLTSKSDVNHFTYNKFKNFLIDEYSFETNKEEKENIKQLIYNYNNQDALSDDLAYLYDYYKYKYLIDNNLPIYDQGFKGSPSEFDYKKYYNLYENSLLDHDNDPAEFFPLLNDSFNEYDLSNNSKEYFNKFISGEIGSYEVKNFWKLLKYNDKLYKRAIKELYKYINNNIITAKIKINVFKKIASELGAISNKEIFLSEYNKALEEDTIKFKFPQKSFIESFGFNYKDILYLYTISGTASIEEFKDRLNYEIEQGYLDKSYLNKNIKELLQDLHTKVFNIINNIDTSNNLSELFKKSHDLFFFYYLLNKCIFLLSLKSENIEKQLNSKKIKEIDKEIIIKNIIKNDNIFNNIYPTLINEIIKYKDEFGYDEFINVKELYNFYLAALNKSADYNKALKSLNEYDNQFGLLANSLKNDTFNSIFNILYKIKNIDSKNEDSFMSVLFRLFHNNLSYFNKEHILFILENLNDVIGRNHFDNTRNVVQDIIENDKFSYYIDKNNFENLYDMP